MAHRLAIGQVLASHGQSSKGYTSSAEPAHQTASKYVLVSWIFRNQFDCTPRKQIQSLSEGPMAEDTKQAYE